MSAVMLMIAMTLTVKVLGWIGTEHRGLGPPPVGRAGGLEPDGAGDGPALRRCRHDGARGTGLSPQARRLLPDAELKVDVV